MKDLLFLMEFRYVILSAWFLSSLWGLYISTYRSFIDRVRAGITPVPDKDNTDKLLSSLLAAPNHQRPYHVESAFLSSIQIILGTVAFSFLLKVLFVNENAGWVFCIGLSFILAFLWERAWIGIASHSLAASSFLPLHLKFGKPLMFGVRVICFPISIILRQIEKFMHSWTDPQIEVKDEKNELAEHIRTLSRESSTLDPEVFEIVGNTLEMGHLHVRDILVPRNQVQVLNCEDSLEENLQIARTCGHTRLPVCKGNLDHCIGIIHVKYAFRIMCEGKSIDFKSLSKAPAILSTEDPLPVALRKMMKWKVHMALVRDEFGGTDGVITLEDILEEVVGEIQDEFDSDERTVRKSGSDKWKISGMSPVHELPKELVTDPKEEVTSFGGLITEELGRIPEEGETLTLNNMHIKILQADETRIHMAEVRIHNQDDQKETDFNEEIK
ncbi:MAG: HlyC/CorC family transporter [Opitutae bacterium]|nr:HlyC/CorC family transporter [Opitutae bacterium]